MVHVFSLEWTSHEEQRSKCSSHIGHDELGTYVTGMVDMALWNLRAGAFRMPRVRNTVVCHNKARVHSSNLHLVAPLERRTAESSSWTGL